MRTLCVVLAVSLAVVLWPIEASARTVFLNGVKLDANVTIQPQTFKDCDVRFDDKGDIHIVAKGYKVAVSGNPGTSPPASRPAAGPRGFWLITKQTQRGAVQYDVDVFINGTHVKKVQSIDEPIVVDVTKYVRLNAVNTVRLVATKNVAGGRSSASPDETMEILLGAGTAGGGTVTVDQVHVSFKRNASEVQNISEELQFTAR